jgi:hypothetical protein
MSCNGKLRPTVWIRRLLWRAELGKAGVAIGSTEIVDEKKPKRDRVAH